MPDVIPGPSSFRQMLGIGYSLTGAGIDVSSYSIRLRLANGTDPDLITPMQECTISKSGTLTTESTASARVPEEYLDQVSDRITDTMIIERIVAGLSAAMFSGTITGVAATGDRMIISASSTAPGRGGIARAIQYLSLVSGGSGGLRFRGEIDTYVQPGDTIQSSFGLIIAQSVVFYFGANQRFMEVAE